MKSRLLIYLLLVFFIDGCIGTNGPTPTSIILASPPATIQPTSILSPTKFLERIKTPTVLVPSPTFSLTPASSPNPVVPTISALPIKSIEQHCPLVQDKMPKDFPAEGSIIFVNYQFLTKNMMILTAEDKSLRPLLDLPGYYGSGKVSPDNKHFAYWDSKDLVILLPDGSIQFIQAWNDRWRSIQGWLDNQQIIFTHWKETQISLDLYNPFNNQTQILSPQLSDIHRFSFESSGWPIWKLVYNSDLTRLVYMRDHGGIISPELVLNDLTTNETLWELARSSPGIKHMPVWSPNGEELAVAASDDPEDNFKRFQLFLITQNGKAQQWIDIKADLGFGNDQLVWSPDNKYLAFFGHTLYILDITKRRVIDFCIPYTQSDNTINFDADRIIWSPDNKKVIFQREDAPAVLIDLLNDIAFPLGTDPSIKPVGWLWDKP